MITAQCRRREHHQVGVHDAFVGVDHEIWIDPEIEGAALARGGDAGGGIGAGGERAGLRAGALEIFDRVLRVLDDAAQSLWACGTCTHRRDSCRRKLPVATQRVKRGDPKYCSFCVSCRGATSSGTRRGTCEAARERIKVERKPKIFPQASTRMGTRPFCARRNCKHRELDHAFRAPSCRRSSRDRDSGTAWRSRGIPDNAAA